MKKKIWSISPSFGHFIKSPVTYLERNGFCIDLFPKDEKLKIEHVFENLKKYDGLIPGTFPINSELIKSAPKLKIIAMAGAGVDHIDLDAATKRNVVVTNVPGTNNIAVAELAIGLIFTLARKILFADREVKSNKWPRVIGWQIIGKTIGIVGMGQIGKELAKIAVSLKMNVLAYDAFPDLEFASLHNIEFCSLEKIMKSSDFISIHVPLLKETENLIDENMLRKMKTTAHLINLSRGKVVNEKALYKVLSENIIAGAAIDVFSVEPPGNNELLSLSNAITTPHMGGYTYEALQEIGKSCAQSIIDLFNGRTPENVVNKNVIKSN